MVCVSWNLGHYLRNPSGEELTGIVWKQEQQLILLPGSEHSVLVLVGRVHWWEPSLPFSVTLLMWKYHPWPAVAATLASRAAAGLASRSCSFVAVLFLSFDFQTNLNLLLIWTIPYLTEGIVKSQGKLRHFVNAPNLRFARWMSKPSCKVNLRWKIRESKIWKSSFAFVILLYFSSHHRSDLFPDPPHQIFGLT